MLLLIMLHYFTVAPLVGAWIETSLNHQIFLVKSVAPLVGAWIETKRFMAMADWLDMSHPSWVRGLKPVIPPTYHNVHLSHPSWVRGLKRVILAVEYRKKMSHPSWVRGLKL